MNYEGLFRERVISVSAEAKESVSPAYQQLARFSIEAVC